MEWDLRMPLWDLAELERGADAKVRPSFYASSGPAGRQAGGLDYSVDLKLGRLGDSGSSSSSDKCKDQTRTSTTTASPTSSAKRARPPSNGVHNAACLVDGCNSDLSNRREYHLRHKVCEVHSKTPVVMVHGQEQRFCQQCSRILWCCWNLWLILVIHPPLELFAFFSHKPNASGIQGLHGQQHGGLLQGRLEARPAPHGPRLRPATPPAVLLPGAAALHPAPPHQPVPVEPPRRPQRAVERLLVQELHLPRPR